MVVRDVPNLAFQMDVGAGQTQAPNHFNVTLLCSQMQRGEGLLK